MREYNEKIENILKGAFQCAVEDSEWEIRPLTEWNILFDNIDKVLEYVNNGKNGKLYVNSNIWYVMQNALCSVLRLYDLRLIWGDRITEHEEVIPINSEDKMSLMSEEV